MAGTEFTGGSERILNSSLEEMKANEMWEKKAEEMMQQNLIPSSKKMNKIRKKMGGSFEIHCMGTRREGEKITAFLATMDGERAVTGVDTYSEISLVDENKARDSWQRIDREPLEIHGVGRATMGDRVMIPVRMRRWEEETMIEARLCPTKHMPRGGGFTDRNEDTV